MNALGWTLLALPVGLLTYSYLLYPIVLRVLLRQRRGSAAPGMGLPIVSIVIPAYNEAAQIQGTIEALIAQDYPPDRRQILILSDASTDGTDEIVSGYASQGVELLRMPVRGGKTAAENASCALLRGEIIVNSDASVRLDRMAVRRLVLAMADSGVGVASTTDISVARSSETANIAEGGYVGYEMRIRQLETLTGGIVGASGSGYAIRAHLHRVPVRADLSRDFSAALTARLHGFSAVSVDDAFCLVPRTASLSAEYRRKVRTIARGVETLLHNRRLLNPLDYGVFSWKLFSHKVCRWLVPPAGILGVIGLLILAPTHRWAAIVLGLAALGGLGAGVGARWPSTGRMPRVLAILTFGVAANVAVLHALLRVAFGHEDHLWEPTRRAPAAGTR